MVQAARLQEMKCRRAAYTTKFFNLFLGETMLIFDAHLDLAWNAMDWNRDLRLPVEKIRQLEKDAGMTDKGRGCNTVCFPDLRRGKVAIVVDGVVEGREYDRVLNAIRQPVFSKFVFDGPRRLHFMALRDDEIVRVEVEISGDLHP